MIPDWLDRTEYPFVPKKFALPAGTMSYLDEGSGSPVVFVHGNPSWSFEFRRVIKRLAASHRCIAPDHLGFGLSDKPPEWDYLPESHANNFAMILDSLDLRNITLVVGDWGGPIGLSYALDHPDRIENIVVTNSWLWSVAGDWYYRAFSGFMGGAVGRSLIRRRNFFAKSVVRSVFGDKAKLTAIVKHHFTAPLASQSERKGSWVFPGQIIGSSDWLARLWERRDALRGKVRTLAWGMKDIAFREKELAIWSQEFPEARVVRFPTAGHFLAEEVPEELANEINAACNTAGEGGR